MSNPAEQADPLRDATLPDYINVKLKWRADYIATRDVQVGYDSKPVHTTYPSCPNVRVAKTCARN